MMHTILIHMFYLNVIDLSLNFFFSINREERRSLNRGWHGEIEDPFMLFGSHRIVPKIASRRESVDSSEEGNNSKDGSASPLGQFRFFFSFFFSAVLINGTQTK